MRPFKVCGAHRPLPPASTTDGQERPDRPNLLRFRLVQTHAGKRIPPRLRLTTALGHVRFEAGAVVEEQLLDGTCAEVAGVGLGGMQKRVEQAQYIRAAFGRCLLHKVPSPNKLSGLGPQTRRPIAGEQLMMLPVGGDNRGQVQHDDQASRRSAVWAGASFP